MRLGSRSRSRPVCSLARLPLAWTVFARAQVEWCWVVPAEPLAQAEVGLARTEARSEARSGAHTEGRMSLALASHGDGASTGACGVAPVWSASPGH
jgi:hypothetical protein